MGMGMGESNQLEEPEQPHTTGECGQGWGCSAFPQPVPTLHPHSGPTPASPALRGMGLWLRECLPVQGQWEGKGLLQCRGALSGLPAITSKTLFPMFRTSYRCKG